MNTYPRIAAVVLAAVFGLGACASSTAEPGAQTPPATSEGPAPADEDTAARVDVKNIAFKPAELTVLAGTKVTWVNRDENVRHTATSGQGGDKGVPGLEDPAESVADGVFDGNLPNVGDTYSHVFKEAGTYDYFCAVHPSMRGTIVVE